MKKRINEVLISDDPENWEKDIIDAFLSEYSHYINAFRQFGIRLTMKPCYYYNGKYHSDKRNLSCSMSFRIRLFPAHLTYSQAVKQSTYQEIFTHTLGKIKRQACGFKITKFRVNDIALDLFLNKYLRKAKLFSCQQLSTSLAIRETVGDVFRSLVYVSRYKNEVKRTFRGFSLEYVFLVITVLLICLHVYWRLRRLGVL